jgi:hypothetical protein
MKYTVPQGLMHRLGGRKRPAPKKPSAAKQPGPCVKREEESASDADELLDTGEDADEVQKHEHELTLLEPLRYAVGGLAYSTSTSYKCLVLAVVLPSSQPSSVAQLA